MLQITDKSKCCGCNACVQRCPKQCIVMHEDEEGFLYPQVDVTLCIDCGLCEKVCPVINQNMKKDPIVVFAMQHMDKGIRLKSSSGGIFTFIGNLQHSYFLMLFFNIKKTLSLKNIRSLFVRPNTIQHKDVQKTETAPLTKKRIIPSSI